MTVGEAQQRAQDRMASYCHGRCGALTLAHTQKFKDRWLVDFDAPAHTFTVIVENGGATRVNVWDKPSGAATR
jgi:hypothetical protein